MKKFFQRLFDKKTGPTTEITTRPLSEEQAQANLVLVEPPMQPPHLVIGLGQSVGQQRDHNEDSLFTLTTTLTSDYSNIPFGFYIVADGMGGHQHGEVASEIAVRSVASYVIQKLYFNLVSVNPPSPEQPLHEMMQDGVRKAHRAIVEQVPGGGTTLTAVLILGDRVTIAHVGDSRTYAINSGGRMEVLTRDHSLVKRLMELGQITADEAAVHPQRNVLYRALGQGEPFEPDITTIPLPSSGFLLLCSDGLWGVVPDKEIHQLVIDAPNPQKACQNLIQAANNAGGPDNITAVLIKLPE